MVRWSMTAAVDDDNDDDGDDHDEHDETWWEESTHSHISFGVGEMDCVLSRNSTLLRMLPYFLHGAYSDSEKAMLSCWRIRVRGFVWVRLRAFMPASECESTSFYLTFQLNSQYARSTNTYSLVMSWAQRTDIYISASVSRCDCFGATYRHSS